MTRKTAEIIWSLWKTKIWQELSLTFLGLAPKVVVGWLVLVGWCWLVGVGVGVVVVVVSLSIT